MFSKLVEQLNNLNEKQINKLLTAAFNKFLKSLPITERILMVAILLDYLLK